MEARRKTLGDDAPESAATPQRRSRQPLKRWLARVTVASLVAVGTMAAVAGPAQAYYASCFIPIAQHSCESANVQPDSAHRVFFQIFTNDPWCGGPVSFAVVDRGNYVVVQSGSAPRNVTYWGWPIYGLYSPQGYFLRMYSADCYQAYGEIYN